MTWVDAVILGTIQGLTEFLPVSSSGHLTLGQAALGWSEPNLLFDIVVHGGTLVAVVGVFRAEVIGAATGALRGLRGSVTGEGLAAWTSDAQARKAALVVIATIPTGIIGLLVGERLSTATSSPTAVGIVLMFNGCLLLATRWMGGEGRVGDTSESVGRSIGRALIIGLGQGLAVLRGLSRSGTTIALGLMTKLDREEAAKFSFLLSIPAILGAVVLKLDLQAMSADGGWSAYAIGFAVSAAVGWVALEFLMAVVRRGALHFFAPYCWLVGIVSLVLGTSGS